MADHANSLPPTEDESARVQNRPAKGEDGLIRVHCESCGKRVKAPPSWAGKRGNCPFCKAPLLIPVPQENLDDLVGEMAAEFRDDLDEDRPSASGVIASIDEEEIGSGMKFLSDEEYEAKQQAQREAALEKMQRRTAGESDGGDDAPRRGPGKGLLFGLAGGVVGLALLGYLGFLSYEYATRPPPPPPPPEIEAAGQLAELVGPGVLEHAPVVMIVASNQGRWRQALQEHMTMGKPVLIELPPMPDPGEADAHLEERLTRLSEQLPKAADALIVVGGVPTQIPFLDRLQTHFEGPKPFTTVMSSELEMWRSPEARRIVDLVIQPNAAGYRLRDLHMATQAGAQP